MINIIFGTLIGILLFFGLVFVVLLCIAVVKVRKGTNLSVKNGQVGPNSIQDIGERVNAVIIDQHGNKQHIN